MFGASPHSTSPPPTPRLVPAAAQGGPDSIVGRPLPSIPFPDGEGSVIDLPHAARQGLVIYAQPGILLPPHDDPKSMQRDALQHDSYIGLRHSFARTIPDGALIALAAYPDRAHFDASRRAHFDASRDASRDRLRRSPLRDDAVSHFVISDPLLKLADALELPTFELGEHRYYERTTIVATNGRIAKVFHPAVVGRDAQQALAWLKLH